MFQLFTKGGPIMWPLFVTSVVSLSVVFERVLFLFVEGTRRDPALVDEVFESVERGELEQAAAKAGKSRDFVARMLAHGLRNRKSLTGALLQAASRELDRFNRGLSVLDTVITLAPLLGLLGTVTGMIRSFGLLGNRELEAPTVITGGIAEALIATAFGLGIAILALIPFNYLNSRQEEARHELEDASNHLELLLMKPEKDHEDTLFNR
jgi:biopolymer transport protein ExbB